MLVNKLAELIGTPTAIHGACLYAIPAVVDERGTLGVIARADWPLPTSVQLNLIRSAASTVRGFHVHLQHSDWLMSADGALHVGLRDLRPNSPTYGVAEVIVLHSFVSALLIPPGVGHAFVSVQPTLHIYGTDQFWSPDDEFGCRWDDPELQLPWPTLGTPLLSERDSTAGPLAQLEATLRELGL